MSRLPERGAPIVVTRQTKRQRDDVEEEALKQFSKLVSNELYNGTELFLDVGVELSWGFSLNDEGNITVEKVSGGAQESMSPEDALSFIIDEMTRREPEDSNLTVSRKWRLLNSASKRIRPIFKKSKVIPADDYKPLVQGTEDSNEYILNYDNWKRNFKSGMSV